MGRFADLIGRHVRRYAHLGAEVASNGAVRTGRVAHLSGSAWLITTYPGLTEERIGRIVQLIRRRLPDALEEFYRDVNGFNYLQDSFVMTGLPEGNFRASHAPPMPFFIETLDMRERPRDAEADMVFFGAYDDNLSRIYMREHDSRVFYCASGSAVPLGEWPSLYDCLESELDRLDRLRDRRGELLDLERSPLPFGR